MSAGSKLLQLAHLANAPLTERRLHEEWASEALDRAFAENMSERVRRGERGNLLLMIAAEEAALRAGGN